MVTAYPVAGKAKSRDICAAFVQGCGGKLAVGCEKLFPGAAMFYGVDDSNVHLYREAQADPRAHPVIYSDNSYFDSTRQSHFRVTRNRLQHSGYGDSDGNRFAALGVPIVPWRVSGEHIVVCPQSEQFMRTLIRFNGDWLAETVSALRSFSKREIRVREWNRDKGALAATLAADLAGAHALVTWSSAAAVSAVLAGVPVVTAGDCAALPMAGQIHALESLPTPARETWAGVLADNQFTLDEMRSGYAWERLQA